VVYVENFKNFTSISKNWGGSMGHERPVVCVFIIIMILFTFLTPFSNAVLSIEKELFLDKSPFWGEMQYRFKKYLETGESDGILVYYCKVP